MSHRPKSVREIYTDSISINLPSLRKDMLDQHVDYDEAKRILAAISDLYYKRLDKIERECEADAMSLESVPSPLELLVECMSGVRADPGLSKGASEYLGKYASAWESWM